MKRTVKSSVLFILLVMGAQAALADYVVITNKQARPERVSREIIADMYLYKIKSFADGTDIRTVDQAVGSKARQIFYRTIVRKTEMELNRYWARRRYSGKGEPPVVLVGDDAVKSWVASTPGAVGYIDKKNLDSSVRVLLTIRN